MKENTSYSDKRGSQYAGNKIKIVSDKVYYMGFPVQRFEKNTDSLFKTANFYNVICGGMNCGSIAIGPENFREIERVLDNQIEFTKVSHDVNGNPRYVCHFLRLLNEGDNIKGDHSRSDMFGITHKYNLALNKAHEIGGKKFHNKQYGGGIVFQSYNTSDLSQSIRMIKEVNREFIKEFSKSDWKRIQRAIFNHFTFYKYSYTEGGSDIAKPFNPLTYKDVENVLGLAYTSSGSYAGLWICNVELSASATHHFIGFTINTDGKAVAVVWDKEENEILIEL